MIGMGMHSVLQVGDAAGAGLCAGSLIFIAIVPLIIWLLIGIWMYKDAKKRDENAVLWLIVGLVAGLIGLIIWIVVRPDMAEVQQKRQQQQQYQQPPPPQ